MLFSDLVFCHTSAVIKYISSEQELQLRDHQALEVLRGQEAVYANRIFHVFVIFFSIHKSLHNVTWEI